jgi:2-dehydro-3-deoxygluconokinase
MSLRSGAWTERGAITEDRRIMAGVLTLGETMALFDGVEATGLRSGQPFRLRIAGAESNFGIALRRLGIDVTWISRLGSDPLGDLIFETLALEGLDLSLVRRAEAPTGVFLKWHEAGSNRVLYRRAGSAASTLEPADVPDDAIERADLVHLTGITTALSGSARETVVETARRARAAGRIVTFDPNYRPALWSSPAAAEEAAREVLPFVNWVLCGLEEGWLLFAVASPGELRAAVQAAGAGDLAVRVGTGGAVIWRDQHELRVPPLRLEEVVDEIGAGDGFAAGFAFGLLRKLDPAACARAGNVIAARALRGTGDWETFPFLPEVESELPG